MRCIPARAFRTRGKRRPGSGRPASVKKRVEQALEELAGLTEQKEERKKGSGENARCSTTDPQARKMKMADGGYRPAYNVQFATDGEARVILAVDVTNAGSDQEQMDPMHEGICERYEKTPEDYLVDGGFAARDDITAVETRGSRVLAPIRAADRMRERGSDPHARQKTDSDEMFAFRQRMASAEAQALYKQRPSIAEFPNAECRNRGLHQFRVRGREKVRTVSLWYAITFNFMRMLTLDCLG